MPPRIPILSAIRQGISSLQAAKASLSTTAAPQALRDIKNTTSSMLNLDSGADPTRAANEIFKNVRAQQRRGGGARRTEEQMRGSDRTNDYMRQLPRRWRPGDVYSPHDMSPSEMAKWRKATARKTDLVDLLGLRPLDMYRNFSVISEFITPHGRIMRSVETGLSPVNQRKMAKAIRRAIGLGLHPSVHRHPELLMRGPDKMLVQNMASTTKAVRF
ncbi:ribosomal protein S18 [Xylaria sp. FL0933]|nr:ribosomal protein S18 [Xylaria sp. FL0933]